MSSSVRFPPVPLDLADKSHANDFWQSVDAVARSARTAALQF